MKILTISKRKKTIILLTIFLSLLFLTGEQLYINAEMSNDLNDNEVSLLSLTPHPGFNITNNGNFTDYEFSGIGAPDDPFIIENYNITTTEENGIYITGTTLYFVIQNCYIDADNTGIYVTSVASNTTKIVNNTCVYNNDFGIRIGSSSNSTLLNNNCTNNLNGIYMSSTTGGTLINNTCVNSNRAIWLNFVPSVSLINNTCINNNWGIDLSSCHNSVIINNTFINCGSGLWQVYSDNNIVENNFCTSSSNYGFLISSSDDTIISFNEVINNNHGIYFSDNSQRSRVFNNTISNNTGYAIELCTGAIFENNTVSNNVFGLQASLSSCTIEYNVFINNENGNRIGNGSNSNIQNNYFYNDGLEFSGTNVADYLTTTVANNWVNDRELGYFFNLSNINIQSAIYGQLILINCSEIVITNQEIYNTTIGIKVNLCEDISINNNFCYNNSVNGILISDSLGISLSDNICLDNIGAGIYVGNSDGTSLTNNKCAYSSYGIYLHESSNVIIFHNTCEKNNLYGIYIPSQDIMTPSYFQDIKKSESDLCIITYNRLIENEEYGIYIESSDNTIFNNTFIDNNLGGSSQAYDEGTGNYWYNVVTLEGNYWSDWSGTGSYSIDGSAGSVDLYPFETPIPPIIAEYNHQYLTVIITLIPLMLIGIILLKRKK